MIHNPPDALIIFAKWPEPGRVKTRLTPPLSPEEAAELYRCMLLDTLDATAGFTGINRLIFFDGPAKRRDEFKTMAPDAELFQQNGNDLGERLTDAFETAFATGCRHAAVIGTDSPHMPTERVAQAFSLLQGGNSDVVLGPTEDGGYYILGMRGMYQELFRNMPWSSSRLLRETIGRAEKTGLKPSLLQPCFDLDTYEDLHRLASEDRTSSARLTRKMLRTLPVGRQIKDIPAG